MDYSGVYLLGEEFRRDALRLRSSDATLDACGLTRGTFRPGCPVRFERSEGSRLYDLLGTELAVLLVVHERIVQTFREHGFSGWDTYTVDLSAAAPDAGDEYHGLVITGRCGPIDDSLTPVEELPAPVAGGRPVPGRRGILFDLATLDGSDLFVPANGTWPMATRAVRLALADAKVSNVSFRPITQIERIWNLDGSIVRSNDVFG